MAQASLTKKTITKKTTTNKSVSTAKKPTTKTVKAEVEPKETVEEIVKETVKEPTKKETTKVIEADALANAIVKAVQSTSSTTVRKSELEPTDMVECKSTTAGELFLVGGKTKTLYAWGDFGDITEVEFQDIQYEKARHSKFLYEPWFVIENEELLSSPKFKDLGDVYDTMYSINDLNAFCTQPAKAFSKAFKGLPKGMQNTVKEYVGVQIEAGNFDSLQKIRIIDETLDSDLMFLIK